MEITLGNLIDGLSIVNLRIWNLEDLKRDPDADDKTIADATRKVNILNVQRNELIEAIDIKYNECAEGKKQKLFGQGSTKSYGKKK